MRMPTGISSPPPPLCLLGRFLFARGRARVDIDDRNVAESVAVIFDLRGVVSAIHQIIQVGQPRRRHDRHPTVVERRGCKQTTDRDATVGYIQMQFIAGPTRLLAFGIAFAADRAMTGQVGQHPAAFLPMPGWGPPPGGMGAVCRRGNRQHPADRPDPMDRAMIVNERFHRLNGRSSSAWAKYADALRRISLAWRSSRFSRSRAFRRSRSSVVVPSRRP